MKVNNQDKIKAYLATKNRASAGELSSYLAISRQAVHRLLKQMVVVGELVKTGRSPQAFYALNLIALLQSHCSVLAVKYNLSLVVLFGSQVSGSTHPESDIDIGFLGSKRFSLNEIAAMQFELSRLSGFGNIELVNLREVAPTVLNQIVQGSKLLYQNDPQNYDRFKIYSLKLYVESKKLLALRRQSLVNFLQTV